MFGADEEDFIENVQFQNSCAFSLMQIGERIKRLSSELTAKYPATEWSNLARFRDVLAHHYDKVNLQMVWNTVKKEITALKEECGSILIELRSGVR